MTAQAPREPARAVHTTRAPARQWDFSFTIMAQNVNEYRFEYTVGGAQAAKTRALANAPGGQVKIHNTHILAVAMEAAGVAMDSNGANHKNISLHMVEDLTLTEVEIAHPLSAVAPTWHAMMPWFTSLFRSLIRQALSLPPPLTKKYAMNWRKA